MSTRVLHDAKQVIEALGGVKHVAEMLGLTRTAVANWYQRGLAPESYAELARRLREAGYEFSDDLFNQYKVASKPPKKRERA